MSQSVCLWPATRQPDFLRFTGNRPPTPTFSGGFSRISTVMCSIRYTLTAASVSSFTNYLLRSMSIGGPSTTIVGISTQLLSSVSGISMC